MRHGWKGVKAGGIFLITGQKKKKKKSLHLISWFVCDLVKAPEHQIMQLQYGGQYARFKTNESRPHMFHNCNSFYLV